MSKNNKSHILSKEEMAKLKAEGNLRTLDEVWEELVTLKVAETNKKES